MRRPFFGVTSFVVASSVCVFGALSTGCAGGAKRAADPSGVDVAAIDEAVDPCDDFYAYACGGWQKATKIPDDRASWTRSFSEIDERNEARLKAILEKYAAGKGEASDAYGKKLADYYTACMDEAAIEKDGIEPIKPALRVIDGVTDATSFAKAVVALYELGFNPLFGFSSGQDFADATQVIGQLEQGGLGLPDRDYYLNADEKSIKTRAQYEEHVAKLLELIGKPALEAKAAATKIVALETALAKVSMKKEDRREPKKVYHPMKLDDVKALSPKVAWGELFDAFKVDQTARVNVAQPEFFKGVEAILSGSFEAETYKDYLRFHVVRETAKMLPKRFVDEDFRFKSAALTGAKQNLPRWKRCVDATDGALGEALGRPFVRETFGDDGKTRTLSMVKSIEHAMERDLKGLAWMDEPTRTKGFEKLHKINNKIGFPDKWRNYDTLEVTRESYARNALRASVFEGRRMLAKIGKPLDRGEWYMTPPAVNAYYDPNMNEMAFPAGILQTPFFDLKSSLAVNYGAIGMVMGHELTHGFDDTGRQFDGDGNLKDWWSTPVGKSFEDKANCLVKQYSEFKVDDLNVNGKLTLGENIADLGGIKLAHSAMRDALSKDAKDSKSSSFTPDQQFFLGYAQAWCTNMRPERARVLAMTDEHSPPKYRVNGVLANTPEFASAFSCKEGKKMARPATDRCEVW